MKQTTIWPISLILRCAIPVVRLNYMVRWIQSENTTITTCCGNQPKRVFKMVKWSRYRPGVAQRVSRGIALLFHDRGTSRGWVVSSTPRPHFTPWKNPVPILQEAGWAPGPVWTGEKSRPHRDSIPNRSASSQSLYRLSYTAHKRVFET